MYDAEYMRRVMPYIKEEYFLAPDKTGTFVEKMIFRKAKDFIDKYNTLPTKEAIIIDLSNTHGIDQDDLDAYANYLNGLEAEKDDVSNADWLTTRTEEWCQEQAIHIAVVDVINILDGKETKTPRGMIPKMLQDALAVSFDPHIGHELVADAERRFEFYHKVDDRIPFHLKYFNKITKNGVPNKTLNICLAGTNVGKSLFLCDLAANYLGQGKNVLYITLEMAEERIAERIDANMMNRPVDDLPFMSKELYLKQIEKINQRAKGGRLIIKEYPTATAHVGNFRFLLNELKLKKQFEPDAIFIDYLNICASARVKANAGLYEMVKGIAEELRGLAVEYCVPVWSATQLNRAGFASSDPDLTNTSESFGLPATADFMFALINSEELSGMNQLLVKVLKNRYGDIHMRNKETGKIMSKFAVGVDRSKQRLYDAEESAQKGQDEDAPWVSPAAEKAVLLGDEVETTEEGLDQTAEPSMGSSDINLSEKDQSDFPSKGFQPKRIAESPFQESQRLEREKKKRNKFSG
jgi:archaellum biogenesis ATPase FlaH